MTTSTLWPGRNFRPRSATSAPRGFTLVEVMIAASLGSVILLATLSTFLFLGRSGANIQNYIDMETQARKALELFAEDSRQASAITWNSSTDVTLVVDGKYVRYYYAATAPSGSTQKANFFYRIPPSASAPSIPASPPSNTLLISGVTAFVYKAYNINGTEITDFSSAAALTAASKATKQLQISLESSRTSTTVVAATNSVLSARFILRNKRVTT